MKKLKNLFYFVAIAMISMVASCSSDDSEQLDPYQKVPTAAKFKEFLDEVKAKGYDPQIVDYRTPEEYAAGHIPGAINIPGKDANGTHLTAEQIQTLAKAQLNPNRKVFTYGSKGDNNTLGFYYAGAISTAGWTISGTYHLMNGYEDWVATFPNEIDK